MKRFALNLILGVVLVAGSCVAGAATTDPAPTGNLTAAVLCALGFSGYCATIDTTTDPKIKNN